MPDYSKINSENAELLQDIVDDTPSYTKPTNSRNAAIMKSIINGTPYNEEPQSEIEELLLELKNKGVGSGVTITPPIYMAYKQTDMDVEYTFSDVTISYSEGDAIGISLNGLVDLSNRNFKKLCYDINTGDCYDSINQDNTHPLVIGVSSESPDECLMVTPETISDYFEAYDSYDADDINDHLTGEIDISEVSGPFYFLLVAPGWNVTINYITLVVEDSE